MQETVQRCFHAFYGRLEEISWKYQQEESKELHSGDLTHIILSGICQLLSDISDVSDSSDITNHGWRISTSQITQAAQSYAENTEADIDIQNINTRKVGRILGKLRLTQAREPGKGTRQWIFTTSNIQKWIKSYAIKAPDSLSSLLNVTDVIMSHPNGSWKEECEILLRLPEDSTLPTIGGFWQRLSDGKIEAGYRVDQLVMALSIYLDKEIELEKIISMPTEQLTKRIIEVTKAEVLHLKIQKEQIPE